MAPLVPLASATVEPALSLIIQEHSSLNSDPACDTENPPQPKLNVSVLSQISLGGLYLQLLTGPVKVATTSLVELSITLNTPPFHVSPYEPLVMTVYVSDNLLCDPPSALAKMRQVVEK